MSRPQGVRLTDAVPEVEQKPNEKTVDLLHNLRAANRGLAKVYETAASRLEDKEAVTLLETLAVAQERMLTELADVAAAHSGVQRGQEPGPGPFERAWLSLKVAVTPGDGPLLAELANDTQRVIDAYPELLGRDLPAAERALLERQVAHLEENQRRLNSLGLAGSS